METPSDATPRRRPSPATKVKVVASRYAQALQKANLEAKPAAPRASSDRNGRPAVASSSSNAASIKVGSGRIVTSKTAAQTRTAIVSSSSKTPVLSTPAVSTTSREDSTGTSSSSSNGAMSINDKLRLYKANKAAQRAGGSVKVNRSTAPEVDMLRAAPRPTLPERITPPTEKAPSRLTSRAPIASTPVTRRVTTPSSRPTPATITVSKPQTPSASVPTKPTTTVAAATRVPSSATEEELELLESLYVQLCFAEAKAAETFSRQEQSAERQMVAAWEVLQSKLQLLHDTSIRLDRELHVRSLEEHLRDQAEPFVQLASVIETFNSDLMVVARSLEASLQRMPTPGVVCHPPELKRQLEGLSSTLQAFSKQINSDGTSSTVADALAFAQGMEESTEQISSLLLQVGHLLEEIQFEMNMESSLKAHAIQDARVQRLSQASDLW